MKYKIVFIISCLILTSCFKDALWNAGQDESRKINLEEYNTIELNSIFDILLVQDTVNYAVVTCGKNIINNVEINEKNNVLNLSQKTDVNWTRTYKHTLIELHFKLLSSIQINNSVKIESKSPIHSPFLTIQDNGDLSEVNLYINCNNFSMAVSNDNFGIYKIRGSAINSNLTLNGSAHFRTENLVTNSCNFIHNGIGDCYVNTKNFLVGKILRNGKLVYYYYPLLKVQIENKKGNITIINN